MAKVAKKPTKKSRRVALVSAFADLPAAKAVLEQYGIPMKLARRGFYCVADGQAITLFDKHPERALPTAVAEGGLELVRNLTRLASEPIGMALGGAFALDVGFHADLDAQALAQAFEADGFRVVPFPVANLACDLVVDVEEPWPIARALLAAGDVEVHALLAALFVRNELSSPPDDVLAVLAGRVDEVGDLMALSRLLQRAKADLVACARPFVVRTWKPRKAKARPRGLPPELATLLGAFDGVPALGVMTPQQISDARARLTRLAKVAAGKPDWGARDPAIRIDRYWRGGWIPFCLRPDDEYLAIDLDPTAQGRKGQIIGVRLNPPRLSRYRWTLGEWLWNELEPTLRRRGKGTTSAPGLKRPALAGRARSRR